MPIFASTELTEFLYISIRININAPLLSPPLLALEFMYLPCPYPPLLSSFLYLPLGKCILKQCGRIVIKVSNLW